MADQGSFFPFEKKHTVSLRFMLQTEARFVSVGPFGLHTSRQSSGSCLHVASQLRKLSD